MKPFLALLLLLALAPAAFAAKKPYGTDGEMPREYIDHVNAAWPERASYDQPPVLLAAYKPIYPISSLLAGQGGSCTVRFTIDETGHVIDVIIEKGSGAMCDHTRIALAQWRYKPATKEGRLVPAEGRIAFRYGTGN